MLENCYFKSMFVHTTLTVSAEWVVKQQEGRKHLAVAVTKNSIVQYLYPRSNNELKSKE